MAYIPKPPEYYGWCPVCNVQRQSYMLNVKVPCACGKCNGVVIINRRL